MKKTENYQTSNAEMVTISRAEYEKLQAQSKRISELESRVDLLMEALRLARHKQFGASSEKSEDTLMEQLSFLFNEAEVFSAADKEEAENVTVVAAHKRRKKHEYTLDSIPEGMATKQVEHRLEGEDLVCPQCCDTMTEIGKEVVRTLEIIPAQMVVREDIYYTYACQNCNKEDIETPVVKAPREKNIIPGSFATPEKCKIQDAADSAASWVCEREDFRQRGRSPRHVQGVRPAPRRRGHHAPGGRGRIRPHQGDARRRPAHAHHRRQRLGEFRLQVLRNPRRC